MLIVMDKLRRIVLLLHIVNLALFLYVAFAFKVEDMSLLQGESHDFNDGWIVTW